MTSTSLAQDFLASSARDPGAVALCWQRREVTYEALRNLVLEHAARLRRLVPNPAEPVAIVVPKSPDAVALVLACLLEDRPFLLPASGLPDAVLHRLLESVDCRYILSPDLVMTGSGTRPATLPSRTGFMLTTSGTTGTPKVVPLTGDAVGRFAEWASAAFGIGPGTRVLNYAPLNFDVCLIDVWTTLACGGEVVLVDPARATNVRYLVDLMERRQVEVVQAVPLFYRLLIDSLSRPRLDQVRHAIVTGDTIPARDLAVLPRLFPSARLYNLYGCTETNDSLMQQIDPDHLPIGPLPLGSPLPGTDVLLASDDDRKVTGPGVGELYVSTPFQTAGYVGDGADNSRFGPHPEGLPGRAYFRTGDLVRRDDEGRLTLQGRRDFRVKVRGALVDLQEVERALLEHPDVLEAAALTAIDPDVGPVLHAVARRAPGSALNTLALRRHCAQTLPPTAVPSRLRVVDRQLPRTSTGKVDRSSVGVTFHSSESEPQCAAN